MKALSFYTTVAFLAFVVDEAVAQTPREELSKLPVCAQACITSAFAACKCKVLDFSCGCTCKIFQTLSETCTSTSCGLPYLKPVFDTIDGTCGANSVIILSSSSSSVRDSTFVSQTESLASPSLIATSEPAIPKASEVLTTSDIVGFSSAEITDTAQVPSETEVPGAPSASRQFSRIDETRGPGITPTEPLLPTTTTTTHHTYSFCHLGSNETAKGWNGTVACTVYHGPVYTGGAIAGSTYKASRFVSWVLLALGWFTV
ncbi:hypothetical protein BKA66DRAFT_44566 [Pyrenochaeta sp. MPI-SDFR-AT-0127]|nr:hypothetical protein BKA66DRAFT_44566 [Pyrenochaeta sp. MPI-SDFR-AT-0127]